ncbi:hypothetical protein [Nocardia jejuensis]|uniref:hypothetical protein n=1 Tax=Nocardia jejuensis TaxID=328049 RepID=UPI0008299721|nr:hypothetical protein [Nocardia jejuensis]
MSGSTMLGVDTDALRGAAVTLRECAVTLGLQGRRVGDRAFGSGNDAGFDYSRQGRAVHEGLERIAARLRDWSAAAEATATVFARAAAEYDRIDTERARAVSEVRP